MTAITSFLLFHLIKGTFFQSVLQGFEEYSLNANPLNLTKQDVLLSHFNLALPISRMHVVILILGKVESLLNLIKLVPLIGLS